MTYESDCEEAFRKIRELSRELTQCVDRYDEGQIATEQQVRPQWPLVELESRMRDMGMALQGWASYLQVARHLEEMEPKPTVE
jgi:hypothetical protein